MSPAVGFNIYPARTEFTRRLSSRTSQKRARTLSTFECIPEPELAVSQMVPKLHHNERSRAVVCSIFMSKN